MKPRGIIATHSAAPRRNPRRHTAETRFAPLRIHHAEATQTTKKVMKAGTMVFDTTALGSDLALAVPSNMATAIYATNPENNPSTISTKVFIQHLARAGKRVR